MWKTVIAPTVVVGIVWIVASMVSTSYLARIEQSQDRVLVENIASIRAARTMEALVWRMQSLILESLPGNDAAAQQWSALAKQFRSALDEAEAAGKAPEEVPLIGQIRERFDTYTARGEQALRGGMAGSGIPPAELQTLASAVTEPSLQLLEINDRMAQNGTHQRQAMSAKLFWVRILFLITGLSVGLFLGYRVSKGLHRSIMQISIRLKDAAGELQQEVGRLAISREADLPTVQQQVDVVSNRIRQVLKELQEARHEAMRHERLAAVGGLAAGVAHELRNPLTSVKLLIQSVVYGQEGPLHGKTLDVVLEEIGRMESTIQGLLDFARPPQLRRSRHDVRDTVQRAIHLTEGRAKQQRVRLDCCFADCSVWVDGDAEQLHQVFVNLLLNGIESMSSGGVLRVTVESDLDAVCTLIRFADSGSGIPAPILPRLFEPFVSSKEHGTGLGLAISRRIIHEHSGRLSALNRAEGGAEFLVELPLAKEHVSEALETSAPQFATVP